MTNATYLDVLAGTSDKAENDQKPKTHWTKIGVAFPLKNGGFTVKLDFIPTSIGKSGAVEFILKAPSDKPKSE